MDVKSRRSLFPSDSKMLATGSMDNTVRLWNPETGYLDRVLSFVSSPLSLAFSRRGHFLAIGFEDGSIKLYDVRENLHGPTLIGHHQAVTCLSFATNRILVSSDNKLASGPDDEDLFFSANCRRFYQGVGCCYLNLRANRLPAKEDPTRL